MQQYETEKSAVIETGRGELDSSFVKHEQDENKRSLFFWGGGPDAHGMSGFLECL